MDTPSGPPARPEVDPKARGQVQTEVLTLGPPSARRRPLLIAVVVAIALVLAVGVIAWRFWPRPVEPLTLDELEGVYAGMVRADGVNDASVLLRRNAPVQTVRVTPAACAPLFDTTVFNQFPAAALDGVGTYWIAGRLTISLFTMRFPDAATAAGAFTRVEQALSECAGRDVAMNERRPTSVRVSRTEVNRANGVRPQVGYAYDADSRSTFAVHVLQFENTVSWQFRYDSSDTVYSPLSAQQLMDGLMSQTRGVLALRD